MLKPIGVQSINRFSALVLGNTGSGKTSLLRTIPDNERVCCLSAEAGLLSVRDLVESGKVEGFEIGSFADLKEVYQLFLSPDFKSKYSWIFLDSLTEISGRCNESMQAKYTKGEDTFKRWNDYGDSMLSIIKGFRDLSSYSVVFTCLPTVQLDDLNRRYIGADIAGKQLKERLPSYFDLVLYLVTQTTDDGTPYRCFLTSNSDRYPGKDRSGKLGPVEKPDLGYLRNKILGGGN